MNKKVREYLSEIGRKGGQRSRRTITREQQARMQAARRERRLLAKAKGERVKMVGSEAIRRAMEKKREQKKENYNGN